MKLAHAFAFATFVVTLALPAVVAAQPSPATWATKIGDRELVLPLPAGFSTLPADATEVQELAASLAPPTNRVLALLVNPNDLALIVKKQAPRLGRYVLVETFVDLENATLSPAAMTTIKDLLRTQYAAMVEQMTPAVKAQLDAAAGRGAAPRGTPDLVLEAGDKAPLELFDAGADAITMISLDKVGNGSGAQPRGALMASAFTTLLLQGKLVYVYVYSEYKSPADLAWVRSATTGWLASIRP